MIKCEDSTMDGVRASSDVWATAISAAVASTARPTRPIGTQRVVTKSITANIISVGAKEFYAHVSQGRFVLSFAKHRLPGAARPAPEYSREVFTIDDLQKKTSQKVKWTTDPTLETFVNKLKLVENENSIQKKEALIYSDPALCAHFVDVCGLAMDPVSRNQLQYVTTLTKGSGLIVNSELFKGDTDGNMSCKHILLVFESVSDAAGNYSVKTSLVLSDQKSEGDGKKKLSHYLGYVADVYRGGPTMLSPFDPAQFSRVSVCIRPFRAAY